MRTPFSSLFSHFFHFKKELNLCKKLRLLKMKHNPKRTKLNKYFWNVTELPKWFTRLISALENI